LIDHKPSPEKVLIVDITHGYHLCILMTKKASQIHIRSMGSYTNHADGNLISRRNFALFSKNIAGNDRRKGSKTGGNAGSFFQELTPGKGFIHVIDILIRTISVSKPGIIKFLRSRYEGVH
jgi:hypothetical protein